MVTATAASAHAGHDAGTGFTSGLLHPMLGLDHLLAMAAIGFWSVRQNATLKNSTPLFVIGGMILGAAMAIDEEQCLEPISAISYTGYVGWEVGARHSWIRRFWAVEVSSFSFSCHEE
ncbi:HupE/UreJ family protein [Marinobacter sp. ELB17]|uniref:HupE/UreJ family protein n=1 Tax=Marinobacter sp. ELB17 TaxID=270374 RepID=UPI001D0D17E7|nr:HupE/UreJ family protein [Marinobacter sp. ELB17]